MPPKDRLSDFQRQQKGGGISIPEVKISMVRQDATERFLEKVENVTQSIDLVESKIAAIRNIHETILSSTSVSAQEKEDQDRVMKEITHISTNIRSDMQALQKEVDKPGLPVVAFRIRKTQHTALARRLMNVMAEYSKEQASFRQKCKTRMKRQLNIANLEGKPKTDEEVDDLLETQNPLIFSQGIVADSQKAKEALADIEARHQDILTLERNIVELKELFHEVAALVEAQSAKVDRIEDNTELAMGNMTDAKDQTAGALSKQKQARKLKICMLVVLVVILFVTAISLAAYLG